MTLREAISVVKKEIKEVNADSKLSNMLVYSKLISKSSLFIQRESDSLKLGSLQDLYQTIKCIEVEEVPAIDPLCNVKSDLTIYRTCNKIPDLYSDMKGVVIKSIRTADRNKEITLESLNFIINLREDSNSKYDKSVYAFYEEGRIYMEKKIPIRVEGMFVYDVEKYQDCDCKPNESGCKKFLDNKWFVPRKLEDSIISAVIQELANIYKRLPEQQEIDKNPST